MNGILAHNCAAFVNRTVLVWLFLLFAISVYAQQTTKDSVTVAVAPAYNQVSNFHRFWLGEGYRKLWAAPVPLKIFSLQQEKGGLTVQGIGGGFQTKSLRLKDASGKQWVLRTVQKYPDRGLPAKFRNTVAQKVLHDQVITVHPFGALAVPPLSKALGLAHTNPQIVYVADEPALEPYRSEFANSVLLFEERGAIDTFKTINTEKLQAQLEGKGNAAVNQPMVLRARLLDMLLGDWDRHEGQWRWEQRTENGETVFFPVPHDRDYVFYHTSGVLPRLVAVQWQTARFQGFADEIRFIETYNFNNRFFDRYFLHALTENDWKEQIAFVQKTLTDDVIRAAVKRMPDTIYSLSGEHIIQTLIARRHNLEKNALTYYHSLAETVDIPASAEDEQFTVQTKQDGTILVKLAEGSKTIYEREFNPAVTRELRLYGLGGNDVFRIEGEEPLPVTIRMIGGDGKDHFVISDQNPNRRRLYIYDRKDEENQYAKKARLRLRTDSLVNTFDRRNFKYNLSVPVINLFFNVDQRTFKSLGWIFQNHSFRKEPYASRHEIMAGYAAARGSFAFRYNGDWPQVFGRHGLNLNILSIGPRNQSNFFGTGNNTVFIDNNGDNLAYYRNFYNLLNADFRLTRRLGHHAQWSIGPAMQYYTGSETDNRHRFLSAYDFAKPGETVFSDKMHAGVGASFMVDTRTGGVLPTGGLQFDLNVRALQQLNGVQDAFGSVQADLRLITQLTKDSGVVLTNRFGAGTTVGSPTFYQMMQIGGNQTLRGFNINRFTGRSMLLHNAELRVRLFEFTSFLFPGSFGLIGFSDVGRVWMPGEKSNRWHHGYGGGVYLVPANVIMIRALVGKSVETTQAYINFTYGL